MCICLFFFFLSAATVVHTRHLGNSTDGAQGFSSEAVRFQMLQVFMAADLRRVMSHSHHRSVRSFDSLAVVTNLDAVQTIIILPQIGRNMLVNKQHRTTTTLEITLILLGFL